jgi:hypothetical protein
MSQPSRRLVLLHRPITSENGTRRTVWPVAPVISIAMALGFRPIQPEFPDDPLGFSLGDLKVREVSAVWVELKVMAGVNMEVGARHEERQERLPMDSY